MGIEIEKIRRGNDEVVITKYYEDDNILGSVEIEVIKDMYVS
jgi:hypothetical protein